MRANPTFRSGRLSLDYDHVETRGVLAGAYLPRHFDQEHPQFLTHLVFIGPGPRHEEFRTGCRQPVDNVVDIGGMDVESVAARPTCPTCAKKWDKIPAELRGDLGKFLSREREPNVRRRFSSGNQPRPCSVCGTLTADNSGIRTDELLCPRCRELADLENEHVDGYHADAPDARCPRCAAKPSARAPNGGYYVWVVQPDGTPLLEGPYGPHERGDAESLARSGATKGTHNRVVTRSKHPDHAGFKPVAEYAAGTGRKTEF